MVEPEIFRQLHAIGRERNNRWHYLPPITARTDHGGS
jgi:hypothetical protein